MKKPLIKKILLGTLSIFLVLVLVLGVHIYIVTRPKAPDEHTKIMARIDFKENISKEQADKIAGWMNVQNGIDHVFINPATRILVFTFYPVKTSATQIEHDFKNNFNLAASRYMPSEEEMKNGCPVAATSSTYKAVTFFKRIF
ncbi:MAG: hypothetical protein JWR61_1053 [Ferruginibacter sp.]|uniref:hypothetical protein n=1 Tax=Ferruginibacter sp. TaxID=1940288 RepID=UPI00265AEB2C|nr:hypothetical protein [Ferruginibacter sp.]MDB5276098.1 hypothetical protein [Ferruginibacter sp.]